MLQKPKICTVFKTVNSIVSTLSAPTFLRPSFAGLVQLRTKRGSSKDNVSSLFTPVQIKPNPDDINVGAELTGTLNKADLLKVLNKFFQNPSIKHLLTENGLDSKC